VTSRQWARIGAAATRYLAETTDGSIPCRFDLATVDRSGRVERIENAATFDGW
jgi:Holliday junction resolvase-like predicted endonuclease